jgi:hypothetical protein
VFNSAKGRFFKDVVFSNLIRDKGSSVTFNLEFTVDPTLLSYEKNVALEQIQAKTQAESATQTPVQQTTPIDTTDTTTPTNPSQTPTTSTPDQAITPTGDNPSTNQTQ